MEQTSRAEAERLLAIADKLLQTRELNGCKEFAILAQEAEPLLDGPDQILAVAEVLLAGEKRINNHHDWYAVLQLDRRCGELELIRRQYRQLGLLLHPDKNKFTFADDAFRLVGDAWGLLSNSTKKSLYDHELSMSVGIDSDFAKKHTESRPSVRRNSSEEAGSKANRNSLWTPCPYCYNLYEYPRAYEGCCLKCQNCQMAFSAVEIKTLPPFAPGKEAYYCCWAFFPTKLPSSDPVGKKNEGFPNSSPIPTSASESDDGEGFVNVPVRNVAPASSLSKKRGRPKKYL